MFRAVHRSSSGAVTVFAASDLHTHVVTVFSQVWVGTLFPHRRDYGQSPHAYVNQRLQIQLQLLMMSGVPLETCWAFNEQWNNKLYYKVASCWLFLLNHHISYHIISYHIIHQKWSAYRQVSRHSGTHNRCCTYAVSPSSRAVLTDKQLLQRRTYLQSCRYVHSPRSLRGH
jgi:hypothetical protein